MEFISIRIVILNGVCCRSCFLVSPFLEESVILLEAMDLIAWTSGFSSKPDNQKVVEELYLKYKRLMFATAGKFTANIEDQEDIVQNALERLVKMFSGNAASKCCISAGYIVSMVRSAAIDFLRKQSQETQHYFNAEDDQLAEMAKTTETLEDLLLPSDSADRLWAIWPKLSREDQIILEGRYILNRTDQELANILKCKPSSIRMKLTRARRRAVKLLSERESNE